jgi:hypothetical protein
MKRIAGRPPGAAQEARDFFVAAVLISLALYLLQPPLAIQVVIAVVAFVVSHLWIAYRFHSTAIGQFLVSLFITAWVSEASYIIAGHVLRA